MWRLWIAALPACFPTLDLELPSSFLAGAAAVRVVAQSSDETITLDLTEARPAALAGVEELWVLGYACSASTIDAMGCLPATRRTLRWSVGDDESFSTVDGVSGIELCDRCTMDPVELAVEVVGPSTDSVRAASWLSDGSVLVAHGDRPLGPYRYSVVSRERVLEVTTTSSVSLRGLWLSPDGILWGIGDGRVYAGVEVDVAAGALDLAQAESFETAIAGGSARFAQVGDGVWVVDDYGGVVRVGDEARDVARGRREELRGHAGIARYGADQVLATGVGVVGLIPGSDDAVATGYTIFAPDTSSVAVGAPESLVDAASIGGRTFVVSLVGTIFEVVDGLPVPVAGSIANANHAVAMDDRMVIAEQNSVEMAQVFIDGSQPIVCDVQAPRSGTTSFLLVRGTSAALVERDRVSVAFFDARARSRECPLPP